MTDNRANLDKIAASYHRLHELQEKQRALSAEMIRACVRQIKSPDSRKRREGIEHLEQLADMLEKPRAPVADKPEIE